MSAGVFSSGICAAAMAGNLELVQDCLASSPDKTAIFEERDEGGCTPLMRAAAYGHLSVVVALVEALKAAEKSEASGVVAKHINAVGGPKNRSAFLHAAASSCDAGVLLYLRDNGANLDAVDSDGHSALQLANKNGHQQASILIGIMSSVAVAGGIGSAPSPADAFVLRIALGRGAVASPDVHNGAGAR